MNGKLTSFLIGTIVGYKGLSLATHALYLIIIAALTLAVYIK